MTLLVLDIRAPAMEAVHREQDLWQAVAALAPRFLIYVMTFMTLGIFWVGQQTQLNHIARSSRGLTWIHLIFLLGVTILISAVSEVPALTRSTSRGIRDQGPELLGEGATRVEAGQAPFDHGRRDRSPRNA